MWVGLEGNRIAFLTPPRSRKARNLDHDPRVAISITDRDQPFTMAQVLGRVSERVVFLIDPEQTLARAYG